MWPSHSHTAPLHPTAQHQMLQAVCLLKHPHPATQYDSLGEGPAQNLSGAIHIAGNSGLHWEMPWEQSELAFRVGPGRGGASAPGVRYPAASATDSEACPSTVCSVEPGQDINKVKRFRER